MQFIYIAKNRQGVNQSGVVDANSQGAALETLQAKGYIVLELRSNVAAPVFSRNLKIFQRVKQKELVAFIRQLSTLVSAQVALLISLQTLAKQTDNLYLSDILLEVAADVEGGIVFSQALARHPRIFSNFFVNMVKSGEASGNLENSLIYLADYLEKQYYLTSRVRGAMTYPAFILGTFIVIAILMMILVVPKLTSFLTESGQELPFATKLIIGISSFLQSWWWALAILFIGGVGYVFYAVKKFESARRQWDRIKLKMPVFGKKVFQKLYVSRIAENLSTLIQGGLSIIQALQITAEVVDNTVYEDIILEAKEDVRIGNPLSSSFARHREIPSLVSQMVATGEQTGSLDMILKKMGQFYSKEIDNTVDTLSSLIEPILIIFIGVGVAILVIAILLPIYNIANNM